MGMFVENLKKEVRLEYMRPEQVSNEKENAPYIYVPFGAIEWHGYHNVLGLDALKAHEQLVALASRTGGVVFPPVYFGAGGKHTSWDLTYIFKPEPMINLTFELLNKFDRQNYQKVILLSGHYPNKNQFLEPAIRKYRHNGGDIKILSIIENQIEGIKGDHAAKAETSFMLYLHPSTVNMELLNTEQHNDFGKTDEIINYMSSVYKDHPCFGIVGPDPRNNASVLLGEKYTENLLNFLENWLKS
jgi:creatinine amidohydrolase